MSLSVCSSEKVDSIDFEFDPEDAQNASEYLCVFLSFFLFHDGVIINELGLTEPSYRGGN
jgi:hypothetical protein